MTRPSDIALVLHQVQERWSAAFNAEQWSDLAALYHPSAHLFGGRPELYEGREGVLRYFRILKPGACASFKPNASAVQVAADCIVSAGTVDFRREGKERLYRMTWTLVPVDEVWRIASHHASALAA